MKKQATAAVVVLSATGLVLAWLFLYGPLRPADGLHLPGVVEIQEVRLGSKVGGRVARLLVEEGQVVSPGQALVVFEVPELENQREQWDAQLKAAEAELRRAVAGPRDEEKRAAAAAVDAAKARLDRLVKGWREEEKKQAASELESAAAELQRTGKELDRVAGLYRRQSASQAEHENAVSARDRARGLYHAAQAKNEMIQTGSRPEDVAESRAELARAAARHDELKAGTRPEDLDVARAKVEQARAKLAEIDINLKEATVHVPRELGRALVEVLAVRPGDLVPAGQPVARVLRADDLWVKIFVPETELGHVPLNKEVEVRIDSHPDKVFRGVVVQKASVSEFTPRNVQSVDERRFQVFAVKVRVDDPQGVFNAGMAAEVVVPRR